MDNRIIKGKHQGAPYPPFLKEFMTINALCFALLMTLFLAVVVLSILDNNPASGQIVLPYNSTMTPPIIYTNSNNSPPPPSATDLTVAGGGIASAATVGVLAFIKDRLDKREVTKKIKGTDVDLTNYIALMNKFFQYSYVYKNYSVSQILDLPTSPNPMERTTLGQSLTQEANGWGNFIQTEYNVPRPTMGIASPQSIIAATQGHNTTTMPPPPPQPQPQKNTETVTPQATTTADQALHETEKTVVAAP